MSFIDDPPNRARMRQAAESAMDMVCHGAVDRTAEAVAAFLHEFSLVAMTRMADRDEQYDRDSDPLNASPTARLMRRVTRLGAAVRLGAPNTQSPLFVVQYGWRDIEVIGTGPTLDAAILDVLDKTPGREDE